MNDMLERPRIRHAPYRLPRLMACAVAGWALAEAWAADPLSISFTVAKKKNYNNSILWEVPAPTGSTMIIKAAPKVLAQTKSVAIKWKGFAGTDQVFPTPPPGPYSVQLDEGGTASFPLQFVKHAHKQWMAAACVNWQPPGYDHKLEDCVNVFLEGIDHLANKADELIKIVSPAHPEPAHNWVKIPKYGNSLAVSVHEDVLSKSTDKLVILKYKSSDSTSEKGVSWPRSTEKMTPKSISLAGVASNGGWVQKSEFLVPDPDVGEWLLIQACLTIEYSGEVCSNTYAYQLAGSAALKTSDQPKSPQLAPIQPLPPLPPPSGGGGGSGSGKEKVMAAPPRLGTPIQGMPTPAQPAPSQGMPLPAMAPAAGTPGMSAPSVPGCTPVAGAPGQYACATREAYAGCERLRTSGSTGIRACSASGERPKR